MSELTLIENKQQRVVRPDGQIVHIVPKIGHLFVCSKGCCCGHTNEGFAPVPEDFYHAEWERRKLRNRVHLTQSGCLGPCALANVVLLWFDGQPIWFHSISTEAQIVAIYDYIEAMLRTQSYLVPPPVLQKYTFDLYEWSPKSTAR